MRNWKLTGWAVATVILLAVPICVIRESLTPPQPRSVPDATFVGRAQCIPCHEEIYEKWRGSDHDRAMAVADPTTVLGDFDDTTFLHGGVTSRFFRRDGKYFVYTEGTDGEMEEFQIAYTFGFEPLQQYLIPFPGGRLQALSIVWDVERGKWFHLYPDQDIPAGDWLHWTGGGQNWNGMCAECHSTHLHKGYDPKTKVFHTTWSEIDVSCEACHGPGSRHVAWARRPATASQEVEDKGLLVGTAHMSSKRQVELCAPCHSRRRALGDTDHRGGDLLDSLVPSLLEEDLYYPDGQILDEVYVYGSFVQSQMYLKGVRCSDCHDVHSLRLVKEGNDLCLQCHRADAYDSTGHHFHKKVVNGRPSEAARCVKCHMPERAYMVIDYRADHSMRVPRPDLSREIGVPNACAQGGCHEDEPLDWLITRYEEWYGKAKKPHYGTTIAAGRAARPEAVGELARLVGDFRYPPIVRATALSLLRGYGYRYGRTAAVVRRALADEDALVRYAALSLVDAVRPERLAEGLEPLLFDPVRAVRMRTARRLAGTSEELLRPQARQAYERALADYVAAMEYSSDFSSADHNLGNLYNRLGDMEKAEGCYKAALEVDALFYPAKVNLALLYRSMGRNEEAELLLREVLRDYPELHDAAYSLGLLLAEEGRDEEAVRYLGRAAEALPERSGIRYNLGLALERLGRPRDAERALREALDLEPTDLDVLYALAQYYVQRGALRQALALAERMAEAHPDNRLGRDLEADIQRALQAEKTPPEQRR